MTSNSLRDREIFGAWWPLAASWLLMSVELPMVSAVVARMTQPEIQLAAFGSVVFPMALVIEGPVIMMLAAATALADHRANLDKLWKFTHQLGFLLTVVHALIAFTPLHDLVVLHLIGAPQALLEPSRLGIQLLLPWSWLIADRRFHQGLLIRVGRSGAVGVGTAIRLLSTGTVLAIGYRFQLGSGVALACATLSVAVLAEALYARVAVHSVSAFEAVPSAEGRDTMSALALYKFYLPLALSPLVALLALPIGSAGVSRMPESLLCLAVWPALNGLSFTSRSIGVAFNEVVVSMSRRRDAHRALWRFGLVWGVTTSTILLAICVSPASKWWFGSVMGLADPLVNIGVRALWFGIPLPLLTFIRSFYQGTLVANRRTRGVTEAVCIQVGVVGFFLFLGVRSQSWLGADVAMFAITAGTLLQLGWLRWRVATDSCRRD